MRPPLKVIATADALVNHDLALQAGDRFRYVGRSPSPSPFVGEQDMRSMHERFPPLACEYPDDADHRFILKALRTGDLLACNEATAARAGVTMPRQSAIVARKKGGE